MPDLQLIGQLEKEIEREKSLLDQEEEQLNTLTKNAAREESSRKAQIKKVRSISGVANEDAPIIEGKRLIGESV